MDLARDRSRLIDHFKRLYTIVVGLAITDGLRKLLPYNPETFSYSSFWMFLAFIVTAVPLFQGGDRSLDITYLDDPKNGKDHNKIAYLWDVYMLLFTAMAFAAIAEAIPPVGIDHSKVSHFLFFYAMTGMLVLDVVILLIDLSKTDLTEKRIAYVPWIVMNGLLAAAFAVAILILHDPSRSVATVSFIMFLCTLMRSSADYFFGRSFMFPKSVPTK